ncbi:hypothetical protein D3C84_490990 [compost metagenome]
MAGIFQFFTSLLAKVAQFAAWLLSVVERVFLDLWNMVTDLFCWLLEGVLAIAIGALDAIDPGFDPQSYYAMLPAETINMLGYIGFTQAMVIVVGALIARFLLQTIPFVRWGS